MLAKVVDQKVASALLLSEHQEMAQTEQDGMVVHQLVPQILN